jgi:hypothetical protein
LVKPSVARYGHQFRHIRQPDEAHGRSDDASRVAADLRRRNGGRDSRGAASPRVVLANATRDADTRALADRDGSAVNEHNAKTDRDAEAVGDRDGSGQGNSKRDTRGY